MFKEREDHFLGLYISASQLCYCDLLEMTFFTADC